MPPGLAGPSLFAASAAADLRRVQQCLNAGEDVNKTDAESGDTALHAACSVGAVAVVAALLAAGARPGAASAKDGLTPLHRAVVAGHSPIVSALLRAGGLNAQASVPASAGGVEEDDPDAGWVAVARRNSAGKLAPDSSASLAQDGAAQSLALQLLHKATELGHVDVIDALVAGGVPVETRDESGRNALHIACRHGQAAAATRLLALRPSMVAASDSAGWTPLHFAARWGHFECCVALIQEGADVDASTGVFKQGQWHTPLGAALAGGHLRLATLLRTAGATDEPEDDGEKSSRMCGATLLCGTRR